LFFFPHVGFFFFFFLFVFFPYLIHYLLKWIFSLMPILSWADLKLIKSGAVAHYWDLGSSMFFSIVDSIHTCYPMANLWLGRLHSSGLILFKLNLLMTNVNFIEFVN
jgi:hypothetical protein